MSCYEWERAEIKFSVKEFSTFKKQFFSKIKEAIVADYDMLSKFYDALVMEIANQKKLNTKVESAKQIAQKLLAQCTTTAYQYHQYRDRYQTPRYSFKLLEEWDVLDCLFTKLVEKTDSFGKPLVSRISVEKPIKPKKSMVEKRALIRQIQQGTKKAHVISVSEITVQLNDSIRTVDWSVEENNHACDRAHESFIGKTFFELLSKVQWTRGTGGILYGDDEYHRDEARSSPYGGNHIIKRRFGPIGNK